MAPDTLLILALIILVFPLFGFIINIFFGTKLGKVSSLIATTIMGIDLILALTIFFNKVFGHIEPAVIGQAGSALQIIAGDTIVQARYVWFSLGTVSFKIGLGIDNLSSIMMIVVTLISFLVHLFSTEYMSDDKRYSRFFSYLGLFTFSMLGIVIANNFLCMYIFWELVGISSYLLIGFWYEKDSAANAGKKAFITNRVGDFGFLIGIMILWLTYGGTLMFDDVFGSMAKGVIPFGSGFWLTMAGIFIFCGAIGKSAQFPLHVWLPDAMEGPTPVSALIHAATMVAAGVYLTARVYPMFTADALTFITVIGAITAFMAATIAVTQTDFKKVLAYSTVSQLGYMIMALGVGAWTTGFFHLVTHAWFKAALFLASGSVIHAMHHAMHHMHDHHTDPQDVRNMGGLKKTMPITYWTFVLVTLAISGVPFTSGFLSKDGILAGTLAYAKLTGGWHWLIPAAGFGAAALTAFYMFRLLILAFHGEHQTEIAKHTRENKFVITFPLILLSVLSIWIVYSPNPIDGHAGWFYEKLHQPTTAVGAANQWSFNMPLAENTHSESAMSAESNATGHEVAEHSESHESHYFNEFAEEMHHAHVPAMIMSLLVAGLGILFAFLMYHYKKINAEKLKQALLPLHTFSYRKWYIDELYQATFIGITVALSRGMAWFDNKFIDGIVNRTADFTRIFSNFVGWFDNVIIDGIVNLVADATGFFGDIFRRFQTGRVQAYVIMTIIGIMALIYFII